MKPLIFATSLATALSVQAGSAQAQDVCMMADEMRAALIDWYREAPVSKLSENNEQIWASKVNRTWTMIKVFSDGSACVLAQGDDWGTPAKQNELFALLSNQTVGPSVIEGLR